MLKNERQNQIVNLLRDKNGFITVKELCEKLFSSESSIRRDLTMLEKRGIILRSYGGAELLKNHSNIISFTNRYHHNTDAKRIIAKKAKGLISDGSIIFLDQSSTAFYLANEIIDNSTLTVVTNNIEILSLLSNSHIRTIASGGVLSSDNRNCLIGTDSHYIFENIHADLVFFSSKSLSEDGIISDCKREEVLVRNSMIKNAETKVFLCDSEKLGTKSVYKQCSLDDIDVFVCENEDSRIFKDTHPKLKIM